VSREPFVALTSAVVPLPRSDIDTDQVIPARFLKTVDRAGLGDQLFCDWRYLADGSPDPEFILNRAEMSGRSILLAGDNFGCGSSREHAPWALLDFGIRCVIAPSFADIHSNNCAKNGLLTVVLPDAECAAIRRQLRENPGATVSVDLAAQTVTDSQGKAHRFEIHPVRKQCLLEGLDDIARTAQYGDRLEAFEAAYRKEKPWL
jgi:3-isopropylmalate/(R)-2-methylmalate dehydratase small subunit